MKGVSKESDCLATADELNRAELTTALEGSHVPMHLGKVRVRRERDTIVILKRNNNAVACF